jgi:hypothetical protein
VSAERRNLPAVVEAASPVKTSTLRSTFVVPAVIVDYPEGKRWSVRLHEKGGKRHEMPAHHKLEAFIDEYLAAAGIREEGRTPSSARRSARPACSPISR